MRFLCEESPRKTSFSQDFSIFGITNTTSKINVYWSKVLRSFYNRVKLFFKCCSNFVDNSKVSVKNYQKFEKFTRNRFLKYAPPQYLSMTKVVSTCSPLRASLNALRGFSHIRFVEEISAKYWLKLGITLKLNVYPTAQHKLPIGKYAIILWTMYCSFPMLSVIVGRTNSMPQVYVSQPASFMYSVESFDYYTRD